MKINTTTFTAKWVLGHKVTPFFTSGNYDLVLAETPPQVPGPPPHSHNTYKEFFLIIEGEMEFMVNGEVKVLKAGDSLDVLPNTLHTFSNKSDKPCKWINIHSPKGFLDFFEKIGVSADEPNAVEKSVAPELIQKVITTAGDHDMIIKA